MKSLTEIIIALSHDVVG